MAGRFCLPFRHIRSAVKNPNGHRLFFTTLGPHSSSSAVPQYCGSRLERFSTIMYNEFADSYGSFYMCSEKLPDSLDDDTIVLFCLAAILDVSFSVSLCKEKRGSDIYFLKYLSLIDKEEVKEEYSRLSARIYLDIKAGNLNALENFRVLQMIFFYYYFGFKSNAKVFDFKTKDLVDLASYCRTLSERVPVHVDMEEFRKNSPYEGKDLMKFFFKIPDTTLGMSEKIAEDYKSSGLSACQEYNIYIFFKHTNMFIYIFRYVWTDIISNNCRMMKWMCLMVKEAYFEVPWETCKERADVIDYLLILCGRLLRDDNLDDLSFLLGSYMEEEDAAIKECTLFLLSKALEYRNSKVC